MKKSQLQGMLSQLSDNADVYVRVGASDAWAATATVIDGVLYLGVDREGGHMVYPGEQPVAPAAVMVDIKSSTGQRVRVRKGKDVYEVLEDLDDRAVLRCVEGADVGKVVTVTKKDGLLLGHYWVGV